mgnify:CR=1 FL=1
MHKEVRKYYKELTSMGGLAKHAKIKKWSKERQSQYFKDIKKGLSVSHYFNEQETNEKVG